MAASKGSSALIQQLLEAEEEADTIVNKAKESKQDLCPFRFIPEAPERRGNGPIGMIFHVAFLFLFF